MIRIAAESALDLIQSRPTLLQLPSGTSYCRHHNSPARIRHQRPRLPSLLACSSPNNAPLFSPAKRTLVFLHVAMRSGRIPSKAPSSTVSGVVSPTCLLKSQPNQSAVLLTGLPPTGLRFGGGSLELHLQTALFPSPPPSANSAAHSPAWGALLANTISRSVLPIPW